MLVSVAITTFNQEQYIENTIKSVLEQKLNFAIEIILSDDVSSDQTAGIINQYAAKYPSIIKVVSPAQNIGMTQNFNYVLGQCKGKYVALCDGDDYWTDVNKLQKQVDFLEQNASYSFCCHGYSFVYNSGKEDDSSFLELSKEFPEGFDITTKNILNKWVTQPLTVIFRRENIQLPISGYKKVYDIVLFIELLLTGNARWLPFNGGCYRIHDTNYWNTLNHVQKFKKEYETFKEISNKHSRNLVFVRALLRSNFYVVRHLQKDKESRVSDIVHYYFLLLKNGIINFSSVIRLLLTAK